MYAVIMKAEGNEGKPMSNVFKVREAGRPPKVSFDGLKRIAYTLDNFVFGGAQMSSCITTSLPHACRISSRS